MLYCKITIGPAHSHARVVLCDNDTAIEFIHKNDMPAALSMSKNKFNKSITKYHGKLDNFAILFQNATDAFAYIEQYIYPLLLIDEIKEI